MNAEHEFHGPNLAYMLGLQERYKTNPESLDDATREYFRQMELKESGADSQPVADLRAVIAAANLVQAIRAQGYLAASRRRGRRRSIPSSCGAPTPTRRRRWISIRTRRA